MINCINTSCNYSYSWIVDVDNLREIQKIFEYLFETCYESVIVGGATYFLLHTEIPRYERHGTLHGMTLGGLVRLSTAR